MENGQPIFRVLGALEVWQGEKRIRLGGSRQERVLGLMLLDANRQVPLQRLVRAVWDDDPPATAEHQVRKIIADLRQSVPGGSSAIRTEGDGYLIGVDDERLDLGLFTARLARAREATRLGLPADAVSELRSALELWRGPVLGGRGGAVIDSVASALEERRLAASEELIELQIASGEAGEVIADLRTLVADHPLRESLRARLMLALYHCGRQAEALEEYDTARRLLADELGIDPGPELSRRYEDILRNSPDVAPPEQPGPATPDAAAAGVRTLPYDLPDFTGRHAELATLLDIGTAEDETLRLVTIDGMGGSGKTALAVHAAHRLAPRFPDAQLCVDLHGFSPGQQPLEPGAALDLLLRMLGVPGNLIPEDTTGRIVLWRTVTADRRMLLLLDNASDAAQVRPLLPVSAGALVLVTSRVRMTGLDGAVAVSIPQMSSADSRELLSRAFGAERVDAEQEAVADLIELCGHLPLALRIAAARLRTRARWTVRDLTARLGAEEGMLRELESGDRSVSATIALSYHALPESHRRLLRRLGAHPGTAFDVGSVAALAGISVTAAERVLDGLLDAHLLEQRAPDRYAFHDLVRSFVRSLVSAEDFRTEQDEAWQRLLADYLVTSRAAADILSPGRRDIPLGDIPPGPDRGHGARPVPRDEAGALRWFDAERPNLISAIRLAIGRGTDRQAALLARDLGSYLQRRGFLRDLLETGEAAVAAARRARDDVLERGALIALAVALRHAGWLKEAMNLLNQALESAVRAQDQRDEAVILSRIGTQHSMLGNYAEALRMKERAAGLRQEPDSEHGQAWTLIGIGSDQFHLGLYDQARDTARRALQAHRELGNSDGEVMALVNAANAASGQRDHDAALGYLREAYPVAERMISSDGLALVRVRMCDAYARRGDYQAALRAGGEALDAARSARRPGLVASAENIMGLARLRLGDPHAALDRYRGALEAALEAGSRYEAARAWAGAGDALHALGRTQEARPRWETALRHFTDMGVPEASEAAAKLVRTQTAASSEPNGTRRYRPPERVSA